MTTKSSTCLLPLFAAVLGGTISLTGCESEGPAEKAGGQIDKGARK